MTGQWYYSRDGVTHGPFSEIEIKDHAGRKMLLENDWLWHEGSDRMDAVRASAALDFSRLPAAGSSAPDWLADVANAERRGPIPDPLPAKDAPNWLEDLRLWYGLELYAAAKTALDFSANDTRIGAIPGWLESWIVPENSEVSKSKKTAAASVVQGKPVTAPAPPVVRSATIISRAAPAATFLPKQVAPSPPPASSSEAPIASVPGGKPIPSVTPSPPPRQVVPEPLAKRTPSPVSPPKQTAASPPPTAGAMPPQASESVAKPISPAPAVTPSRVPEKAKLAPKPEDLLAEKSIHETGFDPKSGKILNPEKFRKWQTASNASQPSESNQSLFEVFRKARTAIENWVDDDNNRRLVMAGELEAIKKNAAVLAILQQFQGYGSAMQEKLVHHLEFMVENRRKYYSACST